jgi:LAO/AO transport system kinase
VPEALNLSDDRRPERRERALAMLDRLERETPFPGAPRIGVTGAPGSGKSSLLDALVRALRAQDQSVAIVAVDPSSRSSGGAILGDRIRVRSAGSDPGVFVRSMAARERLGGVSDAARAGVAILAPVFDHVFVETVGVGQSESDVVSLVDTLVFLASPGSGDVLQYIKAGLIELPDVFVVNKIDLGESAVRTAHELESAQGLAARADGAWKPPVLRVSARDGSGIEALLEALRAHQRHQIETGALRARRRAGAEEHVLASLALRYGSYGLSRVGGPDGVRARLREMPDGSASSFACVEALGAEIEDALRKTR